MEIKANEKIAIIHFVHILKKLRLISALRYGLSQDHFQIQLPKIPNKGRTSNKMGAPLIWISDGIISKSVCPIYLKIDVLIVHIAHSLHTEFQVNRMNRFRDIAIESREIFFDLE